MVAENITASDEIEYSSESKMPNGEINIQVKKTTIFYITFTYEVFFK